MKNFSHLNTYIFENKMQNRPPNFYNIWGNLGQIFSEITRANNLEPDQATTISTGLTSAIVKFSSNNQELLAKIPSDDSIISEVFFLKKLQENRIPCPNIIAYDTGHDFPYLIMEWVNKAQDFQNHIVDKTAYDSGALYAKKLHKVHKIGVGGFGFPEDVQGNSWSSSSWIEALEANLFRIIEKTTPLNVFESPVLSDIYSLTINNARLNIKTPRMIHGDIPNGLMRHTPKIDFLGFIDPGKIKGGDYLYDVATAFFVNEKGKIGKGFMRGIRDFYFQDVGLNIEAKYRFHCLELFNYFWKTCYFFENAWDYKKLKKHTLSKLEFFDEQR